MCPIGMPGASGSVPYRDVRHAASQTGSRGGPSESGRGNLVKVLDTDQFQQQASNLEHSRALYNTDRQICRDGYGQLVKEVEKQRNAIYLHDATEVIIPQVLNDGMTENDHENYKKNVEMLSVMTDRLEGLGEDPYAWNHHSPVMDDVRANKNGEPVPDFMINQLAAQRLQLG